MAEIVSVYLRRNGKGMQRGNCRMDQGDRWTVPAISLQCERELQGHSNVSRGGEVTDGTIVALGYISDGPDRSRLLGWVGARLLTDARRGPALCPGMSPGMWTLCGHSS